jgi:Holliday junction resolvase RusA-like endonuclease
MKGIDERIKRAKAYGRSKESKNMFDVAISITDMEQNTSNASVAEEKAKGLDTRVAITVTSYRKRDHDPDGISVKAVLDGIVRSGLLPDDSTKYVKEVTFKSIISKEEKTVIEITT